VQNASIKLKYQSIRALKASGRPSFVVNFRHPQTGLRVSRSLGTRDASHAKQLARDLERLANAPPLWALKPEDPQLIVFDARALEIFYGRPVARPPASVALSPELKNAIDALAEAGYLKHIVKIEERSEELEEERRLRVLAEQRAVRLEREKEDLNAELERYRHAANHHIKATLAQAQQRFEKLYAVGHAESTVRHVKAALKSFVASTGPDKNLGKVQAREIEHWIVDYKSIKRPGINDTNDPSGEDEPDHREVSATTRLRLKAYVSVFWNWATRAYDLAENPTDRLGPIAGGSRAPEHILALRRLEDVNAFLEGLKPWPYWRAWAAVAVLAGPRWAEQQWLKVDDVYLKEGYLRVTSRASGPGRPAGPAPALSPPHPLTTATLAVGVPLDQNPADFADLNGDVDPAGGAQARESKRSRLSKMVGTKTGRERNVPIERTTLLPILTEYLAHHPGKYRWLFPSTLEASPRRTKTPPGLWSGSSSFLDAWKRVSIAAEQQAQRKGGFWSFGPAEWRHSFGTALGMCGYSGLEIARMMGNSPAIADRHYISIASEDTGQRWPFRWR
jgi:integrase